MIFTPHQSEQRYTYEIDMEKNRTADESQWRNPYGMTEVK